MKSAATPDAAARDRQRSYTRAPHCDEKLQLPFVVNPTPRSFVAIHRLGERFSQSNRTPFFASKFVRLRTSAHPPCREVDEVLRGKSRDKSRIRACVEHAFAVAKRLRGFTIARYRRLAKNANRVSVVLSLANVYLSRTRLIAQVRP